MSSEAKDAFNEYTTSLTGVELQRYVMRRLDALQYVPVHPRGGVYFTPAWPSDKQRAGPITKVVVFND